MKKLFMTLVELIVVLSILVVIASVTATSFIGYDDSFRVDETMRRGQLIVEQMNAIESDRSSFLSDMGRLPKIQIQGAALAELIYTNQEFLNSSLKDMEYKTYYWNEPIKDWVDPKSNKSPAFFDENDDIQWNNAKNAPTRGFQMNAGWKGPYLLSYQQSAEYDGWGNLWNYLVSSNNKWDGEISFSNDESIGSTIFGVGSLGKDNQKDEADKNWMTADQMFLFEKNRVQCELTINLYNKNNRLVSESSLGGIYQNYARVAVYAPYMTNSYHGIKRILAYNNYTNGSLVGSPQNVQGITVNLCDVALSAIATTSLNQQPADQNVYPHEELLKSPSWDGPGSVTLYNLTPGRRVIFAYCFYCGSSNLKSNSSLYHKYSSGPLVVDLKPGSNIVDIYLNNAH